MNNKKEELQRVIPPPFLFHDSSIAFLESIFGTGIRKIDNKVKLYENFLYALKEAIKKGEKRIGYQPIVLKIEAQKMKEMGYKFLLLESGIWITEIVPPEFIVVIGRENILNKNECFS